MRSSHTCGRSELRAALGAAALALAGCGNGSPSQPDAATAGCTVEFTGDVADEAHPASCATLSQGDAGDWTLTIDTSTPAIARVHATVDVGSAPAPGTITNETAAAWDLVALSNTSSCTYQAGSDGVPNGSFTLALTSVDTASGSAHGTLDVVAYVHAPPTTDCGFDDVENISIQF